MSLDSIIPYKIHWM